MTTSLFTVEERLRRLETLVRSIDRQVSAMCDLEATHTETILRHEEQIGKLENLVSAIKLASKKAMEHFHGSQNQNVSPAETAEDLQQNIA